MSGIVAQPLPNPDNRDLRRLSVGVTDPDYLEWMLAKSFGEDTKQVVREALARTQ